MSSTPLIPPAETIKAHLPQVYTENNELYNPAIPDGPGEDPTTKLNLLVTQRNCFFSENGYVTKEAGGIRNKIWARLHFDTAGKVNGTILYKINRYSFNAWKDLSLAPEGQPYSVSWSDLSGYECDPSIRLHLFPTIFKKALLDEPDGEEVEINLDMPELTEEQRAEFQSFCGRSFSKIPSEIKAKLFTTVPDTPDAQESSKTFYIILSIVIFAGVSFFALRNSLTTPVIKPTKDPN